MGTRSLTVFKKIENGAGVEIGVMYRQYDGYLEGMGMELAKFLAGKFIVNGFNGDDQKMGNFNGMECLAASVIAHFKDSIGNVYLYPPTTRDIGEEFIYTVYPGPCEIGTATIKNRYRIHIEWYGREDKHFQGTPEDFLTYIAHNPE